MSIKGWPTQEKDDRLSPQYATVEPVRQLQNALSVLAHEFVREVGTDSVEANSTTTVINATGHAAQVGDVIRLTSGTLSGQEIKVYSVATNSITLAEELASAPALGVTFQILRHKYPVVESTGEVKVSGTFSEVATAADGGALPAVVKVVGGYDGSAVQVIKTDANGEIQADVKTIEGVADSGNSTSTPLAGGASFTGTFQDAINLASIQIGVKADQNSATDGFEMQFSDDGVNVHHVHYYTYLTASGGIGYLFAPEFRYYRIKFTNGATPQTSLIIDVTTRSVPLFPSQYRVSTVITNETQALMTKSVITGQTTGGGGGYVNVKVNPSGALTVDATLSGIDSALDGQKTMSASLPVVIASDQSAIPITDNAGSITVDGTVAATQSGTWNINNVSGSISLPTGAATETTLGAIKTAVELLDNTVSGSELQVDVVTSALPAGAATESTLSTASSTLTTLNGTTIPNRLPTVGTKTMSGSVSVTLASNQTAMPIYYAGRSASNRARIDYTSTSVTTAAYTQLLASTSAAINEVEIFDSSGQTLVLATGTAGAEADQVYIFPGGNGRIPLAIATSTRVAIKAVSATANSGEISVNFYS